jgi:hypothetical protein
METEHGLRLFGTDKAKASETESPWPTPQRLNSTQQIGTHSLKGGAGNGSR